MKKLTGFTLAALLMLGTSGCSSEENQSIDQPLSAIAVNPTDAELQGVFLSAEEFNALPDVTEGEPKSDGRVTFFEDIERKNVSACSGSTILSFPGLGDLKLLSSNIISFEQSMPTYVIQWVYDAGSFETAESLVSSFGQNFLNELCYLSLGKEQTNKSDLTPELETGEQLFLWVDTVAEDGVTFSRTRMIGSFKNLVYFSYGVLHDSGSPLTNSDMGEIMGAASLRFVEYMRSF